MTRAANRFGRWILAGTATFGVTALVQSPLRSADVKPVQLAANASVSPKDGAEKESAAKPSSQKAIADFRLPDTTGKQVSLHDFADKAIVVVYFLGIDCPISNLYVKELGDLQKQYAGQSLQVIGIHASAGITAARAANHSREYKVAFPVLLDAGQHVADQLGATRTAEVFLLDRQRTVRYHGAVDDRFGYTFKRNEPTRRHLDEAVKELLASKPVSMAETTVRGCLITRDDHAKSAAPVTYAKEISRILQSRCQECHRPGEAAPFALMTHDDAVEHSAMIKEVVTQRRMPPWHADPHFGEFSNNRRMLQTEIDQLVSWIDSGMPLGDVKELPPERQYAKGWTIGKPDYVFEIPKDYPVRATGTVEYQYFTVPTNFKEDVWIQAAEARPGNPAVVHHIIVFYREPKVFDPFGNFERQHVCGTAPGDPPFILPPGVGRRIPAGAELVFQVHYTPNGKATTDRSKVGFVVYKDGKKPQWAARTRPVMNFKIRIPAGDANYLAESNYTFPEDAKIYQLMPHMHVRGKDFLYELKYPDGHSQTLLSVPQFDFNWQNSYRLAQPIPVPKGTTIHCVAHFDNSKANPSNPDPTKTVTWGDQTWEEMMIGWMTFVWNDPSRQGAKEPADPERQRRRRERRGEGNGQKTSQAPTAKATPRS